MIPQHIASYGRRRGRRLRPSRQGLMDELLPELTIDLPETGTLALPKDKKEHWLEIGFGAGEHLAHQAALNPNVGIIGCEPFINGIATLLALLSSCAKRSEGTGSGAMARDPAQPHCGSQDLNVRIYNDDARLLIEKLPDHCLDKVFILYPDPWPKARHHKRRLISKEFLDNLARVMKPGAELRLATDHSDYCTWMLERLLAHPAFQWTAKTCDDWLKPWADWIPTRYEQKRLAGMPTYLSFKRL